MISLILLSILTLSRAYQPDEVTREVNGATACTTEYNPICCPDPKHVEKPIDEYRPYGNVCEYSHGKDENGKKEDPINCGYGTCPVCPCQMIYKPVCCDGVEYPSDCEANCAGESGCSDGACSNTCACTLEYRPVCCPKLNDAQYSNPCQATCDGLSNEQLIACHYGTCEKPETDCICTMEYDPQCCTVDGNKVDYSNKCVAQCDGINVATQCSKGECEICACTMDWFPVCCPPKNGNGNGHRQTYGNSCAARCERSEAELLECYYGECPPCVCPMILDTQCCEGIEYGNECEAECVGARNCNKGSCTTTTTAKKPVPVTYESDDDDDQDDDNKGNNGNNNGNDKDKENKEDKENENKNKENENENVSNAFSVNSVRNCQCTMEFVPTCCDNPDPFLDIKEITYGNKCEAECDDATNCRDGKCYSSEWCTCTTEFNAVCCPRGPGEPGEQFSNPCQAACVKNENELIGCHYGMCPDACPCPAIHAPVCCGGKEYGNACSARCSGETVKECSEGSCATPCPLLYEPQCCNGGVDEYGNKCMADANDAKDCKSKTCETECACNLIYAPVCCGDTTYGNVCQARCANEDLIADCEYGECKDVNVCDCKDDIKPVCCHGEDEYKNKCLAKCAMGQNADLGYDEKSCKNGACNRKQDIISVPQIEIPKHSVNNNNMGKYAYGLNVNTILLGLILVAMVSFVCIYYKRTDPAQFRKNINYESDQ